MRVQRVLPIAVCFLLAATAVVAGSKPVAVSPGDASKLVVIGDTCPTFSWGVVEGAKSYELLVYHVGEEAEDANPVLRETIAGSASGWTPSLDRCLERGGEYAWSVRAIGKKKASDWSSPSLFQVASGPSEVEFDAALQLVRSYLDAGDAVSRSRTLEAESKAGAGPMIEALASSLVLEGPANPELTVDGEVLAEDLFGQTTVSGIAAAYLLHLYPATSPTDGLCLEDSDRGSTWVRSSINRSLTGDGVCVCVRKWSTITDDWAYVAEALGEGDC